MRSRPGRPQIAGLPEKAKVKTLVLRRVSFQITESPLPAHSISSTIWKEMLVSTPPLSSPLPGNPGPWLGRGLSLRPRVFLHRPLRSPGHLGDWPKANAKGSLRSFHCHFNLSWLCLSPSLLESIPPGSRLQPELFWPFLPGIYTVPSPDQEDQRRSWEEGREQRWLEGAWSSAVFIFPTALDSQALFSILTLHCL